MFQKVTYDVGTVKPEQKLEIRFPYKGILRINSISKPCDCASAAGSGLPDGDVVIDYTTKRIPPHLVEQNTHQYKIQKTFTVKFESVEEPGKLQETILIVTGTVKK